MVQDKMFLFIFFIVSIYVGDSSSQIVNVYCNTITTLSRAGYTVQINFPDNSKYSCEYVIRSAVDTYFAVEVTHNMIGSGTSCTTQYVKISPDGDPQYRSAVSYCGFRGTSNPLKFNTVGNEIRFYITTNDLARTAQIKLQNYALTSTTCKCSWSGAARIANGNSVDAGTFIGNVAFVKMTGSFPESFCGGTIISASYIVTAAHCVKYMQTLGLANVQVHVGRQNITKNVYQDTACSERYSIKEIYIHPYYNDQTDINENDIALVRTSIPIRYCKGVGPACIPKSYANTILQTGTTLTAIGFGSTQYALDAQYDPKSWLLQYTFMYVNTALSTGCNRADRVCAQGPLAGTGRGDTCQRDSGTGIYAYINSLYQLMAITSEGPFCGSKSSYALNVNVPYYLSWISQIITSEILCNKS